MNRSTLLGLAAALAVCTPAWAQDDGGLPNEPPQVPGQGRVAKTWQDVKDSYRDANDTVAEHILNEQERRQRIQDYLDSGEIVSEAEIRRQIDWAIEQYGAGIHSSHHEARYLPWSEGGSRNMIPFLVDHGNTLSDEDYMPFITGQEYALKQAIVARNEATGQKLNIGEVFLLALQLNGGDVYKALLTAHTTLRALARGKEGDHLQYQVPDGVTDPFGTTTQHEVFRDRLEHIGPLDNTGDWYHMFGTAVAALLSSEFIVEAGTLAEEAGISGDHYDQPTEWYYDRMGADMGAHLRWELTKDLPGNLVRDAKGMAKGLLDRMRGKAGE